MAARKKTEVANLSIMDAVETLESIADLNFEREVSVATEDEINQQNHLVTARAVKWVGIEDADSAVTLIKETFHVVLDYLREFYKNEYRHVGRPQDYEGIKTIIVLAGEAAQKLDRFTTLFAHTKDKSARSLKEFQELQDFYLTRIARKIDEAILGKWILELTKGALERHGVVTELKGKKPISVNHVFIDLDSVKTDTEYELFYLRKEDGSRFFNPRLIRNIKLVCDFGETIGPKDKTHPLESVALWQDFALHKSAKSILESMGALLDRFFREARFTSRRELVRALNYALVALMMSGNPRNLLKNTPIKSCGEYFLDFQNFLRQALKSGEYQRFIVYPPKKSARLAQCMLEVTHHLCRGLFTSVHGLKDLFPAFDTLYREAREAFSSEHLEAAKKSTKIWNRLAAVDSSLKKLLKQHPYGPLEKDLTILGQGVNYSFDPMIQYNTPFQLYSLYIQERKLSCIRAASPTEQSFIDKAKILEEFKGFLRAYSRAQFIRRHLLFNLQDKTSWKEHARSSAVEELPQQKEFANTLIVITLAKDTEFYHQLAPYHLDNHANVFIQHFMENLMDEHCGFFFPKAIKKHLFPEWAEGVIQAIHQVFFGGKNVLSVANRLDFIEIFYLMLQLKVLEMLEPDTFSFSCKDAIDIGGTSSLQLYLFLQILNQAGPSEIEIESISFALYSAPILIRERTLLPERFDRLISVLRKIEATKEDIGAKRFKEAFDNTFGAYFKTPILSASTVLEA